jgi:hypothetical protein
MASDGSPGAITSINPVIGIQPSAGKDLPQSGKSAPVTAATISSGNILPQSVKSSAAATPPTSGVTSNTSTQSANNATVTSGANGGKLTLGAGANSTTGTDAKNTAASRSDPQTLVDQVNKFLNDSGRPDEFRVDPTSADYIQQVNPANGAVVAEYSVSEFPALARSVGASGLLIDAIA